MTRREWLAVLITFVVTAAATTAYARAQNAGLRERNRQLVEEYEAFRQTYEIQIQGLSLAASQILGDLQAYIDEATQAPPEVPAPAPEIEFVLDTAQLNAEIAVAVRLVRAERDRLREVNTQMRQQLVDIRIATGQALQALRDTIQLERTVHAAAIARADSVIAAQTEIINKATGTSIWEKLAWGVVGGVVGYAINEATGSDVNVAFSDSGRR